jgi:hypothetical protein
LALDKLARPAQRRFAASLRWRAFKLNLLSPSCFSSLLVPYKNTRNFPYEIDAARSEIFLQTEVRESVLN